jgi:CDP-paratose 2-epimerase
MSCIYGPHQFGTEDQAGSPTSSSARSRASRSPSTATACRCATSCSPTTSVDAFLLAQANIRAVSGEAFNIGGGPGNTISLIDLLDMIERLNGSRPDVRMGAWRPGDQRYYVSDAGKMRSKTGWSPKVGVEEASPACTTGCATRRRRGRSSSP